MLRMQEKSAVPMDRAAWTHRRNRGVTQAGARPRTPACSSQILAVLRPGVRGDGFLDLLLDRFEVERGALLHGRVLDRALCGLRHDFLNQNEAPEVVREELVVVERAG